ncbi:DUF551 domain-containing protein [Kingella oralis]|jgi:hypothetical protein|uniref:DUF551 domain-containing protein n=1 Tax=Kingella oralis TaxID=505 RepID=UPI002050C9CE|nr:MAG TPA: Protein of unknown function (DUF551) [Caudoviricetes sp.]DAS98845.1 MAG TPA: Protein of unknown function (DUF551) [Caudoviricetes sp.]
MTPEQIEKERQAFEKWLIASGLIATNHEFSIACKWFKEAKRYNSDLVSGLFNVWLARSLQPAWISVEERLPELRQFVLIYDENHQDELKFGVAMFNGWEKENPTAWRNWVVYGAYTPDYVTHWQPLPEPPKAA